MLCVRQKAAVDDFADHVAAFYLVNAQLDEPVGEQMREPCSTFSARVLKVVPPAPPCRNLARRNDELFAGLQQHGLMILQQEVRILALAGRQDAHRLALLQAHLRIIWISASFPLECRGKVQAPHRRPREPDHGRPARS